MLRLAYMLLAAWLPALAEAQESTPPEPSPYGGNVWSRATLGGDWGGVRDRWAAMGIVVGFDVTYTFQGLASGGFDGPLFHRVSDEGDTGNTASGDLTLELDTGKAGMWEGGRFDLRVEGRAGRSVLQHAGSVSAVDNDALFPNVVDRFDQEALAVTALTFTQHLGAGVTLFGGLLDNAEGDANELAGSAVANGYFPSTGGRARPSRPRAVG